MLVEARRWCGRPGERVVEVVILTRAFAARPDVFEVAGVLRWDFVDCVTPFCRRAAVAAVAEVGVVGGSGAGLG